MEMMQNDGGGSGKLLGGLVLAGEAPSVGDELRSFLGPARTPASFLRRSWARIKGEREAGECGANGDESVVQRGEKEKAARLGRGRLLPQLWQHLAVLPRLSFAATACRLS